MAMEGDPIGSGGGQAIALRVETRSTLEPVPLTSSLTNFVEV